MNLGPIGQITLTVQDIGRATKFYGETLGLPFLFRAPPALAFFDCGGLRLMLSEPERKDGGSGPGGAGRAAQGAAPPAPGAPASVLYFRVDDIDAAHREISSRGAVFADQPHLIARMPDHELWMTFFHDPDGNTLALMEERRS
jgi:methylmalonyl-CoA/ethylmalonyl-CoA epimerase